MIQQRKEGTGRNLSPVDSGRQQHSRTSRRAHGESFARYRHSFHAICAHRGVNCRHQQGCGNPFPADVSGRQNQLLSIQGQKVIVVAAHSACWPAESVHLQRLELRHFFREQLSLDFLRDHQFVLEPLFLFLLEDQPLDGSRHGVERIGQQRKLIA